MLPQVIRSSHVLTLGLAEGVSYLGSWISTLAIFSLVVFQGEGTTAESSVIFLAALAPMLLVGPLAGRLTDQVDRRTLLVAAQVVSGVVVAPLVFLDGVWVYVIIAAQSTVGALMMPARIAALPDLVPREELTRVNAFLQQVTGLVKIGGPMLAGLILTVLTPHQAIVLDVISYFVAGALLLRLPPLPPPNRARAAEKARQLPGAEHQTAPMEGRSSRSVWQVLHQIPQLFLLFVMMFLGIIVIMSFDVLSAVFTRDVLQADEGYLGMVIGLIGVGMIGATIFLMKRSQTTTLWRDLLVGMLLLNCLPLSLALAAWLGDPQAGRVIVAMAALVGGLGNGLAVVQVGTLIQVLSPEGYTGRVSGVYQSTIVAGQLIAILLAPALVPTVLPLATYFVLAALAGIIVVVGAVFALRRMPAPTLVSENTIATA